MKKLSILVLGSQVAYSSGGAELLLRKLNDTFNSMGHDSDILTMPFVAEPKTGLLSQMMLWRTFPLDYISGRKVDMVVATKFPTYLASHPCKVVWLIHQHRQAYELVGTRYGDFSSESLEDESVRTSIIEADKKSLSEAKSIFTISDTVSSRLKDFLSIDSTPLLPPVPIDFLDNVNTEKGNYILSVGRLCSTKRTDLIIKSMPLIPEHISLKVVGVSDEPDYESYLKSEIEKHKLSHRIELMGSVSEDQLRYLYANCFAVFYGPYDEDYGFVTYESVLNKKPVVTTLDSGFVQNVVSKYKIGEIVSPESESISEAFKRLMEDEGLYQKYLKNMDEVHIPNDWNKVAETLIESALGNK